MGSGRGESDDSEFQHADSGALPIRGAVWASAEGWCGGYAMLHKGVGLTRKGAIGADWLRVTWGRPLVSCLTDWITSKALRRLDLRWKQAQVYHSLCLAPTLTLLLRASCFGETQPSRSWGVITTQHHACQPDCALPFLLHPTAHTYRPPSAPIHHTTPLCTHGGSSPFS